MKVSNIPRIARGLAVKHQSRRFHRDGHIWIFGEWFGKKCLDNSLFFANYVANRNQEIQCYWMADEGINTESLCDRITVLQRDSEEAMKIIEKCGVAVFNQTFADFTSDGFNHTEGAVSVQLWHGVPWKKIGHDGNYKPSVLRSAYYRLLDIVDYAALYVSPSEPYDKVLHSAFGVPADRIVHAGYARNSIFYHPESVAQRKRNIVSRLHEIDKTVDFSKCKIVVYMPTFRKNPYGAAVSDGFSFKDLRKNQDFVDYITKNNVVIVEKAHFVNQTRDGMTSSDGHDRIYSLNDVAAQDLLCAADLLVTDYSGVFFDYLLLDRPIVHYLYDYDEYRTQDRGLYYDKEDVIGGEEADDESQLVEALIRNLDQPDLYKERRQKIRSIYMTYDNEDSCEVLYQEIMKEVKRRKINESTDS